MKSCIALFRGKEIQILATLVLLLSARARAIDLLVYNNNSGPGSLQQAVNDNNALGGGNTITFWPVFTNNVPGNGICSG